MTFGIVEGLVIVLLVLLIYIHDLNEAIKFCKIHDFSDDTNLFPVTKLKNYVNHDLKNIVTYLNANKISLNTKKGLVNFKYHRKKLDSPIKLKLNHRRLYPAKSVKYHGVKM